MVVVYLAIVVLVLVILLKEANATNFGGFEERVVEALG